MDESQAPPAVADDADDDDNWDLEGPVVLDKVKLVGAKGHLRDFLNMCRAK